VIADVVVSHLMQTSILTEQLRRSGVLVKHEYEADILDMVPVSSVMVPPLTIPHTMTVAELIERINQHDPRYTAHQALLLTDEQEHLAGIVTRGDLIKAMNASHSEWSVLQAGTATLVVAYPSESVRDALARMSRADVGRLPVVSPDDPTRLLGYVGRAQVFEGHKRRMQEEQVLEDGWRRVRSVPNPNADGHGS
jgi:CIC family chloride channel protein